MKPRVRWPGASSAGKSPWSLRSSLPDGVPIGMADQMEPLVPYQPGQPVWVAVPGMLPLVDPDTASAQHVVRLVGHTGAGGHALNVLDSLFKRPLNVRLEARVRVDDIPAFSHLSPPGRSGSAR